MLKQLHDRLGVLIVCKLNTGLFVVQIVQELYRKLEAGNVAREGRMVEARATVLVESIQVWPEFLDGLEYIQVLGLLKPGIQVHGFAPRGHEQRPERHFRLRHGQVHVKSVRQELLNSLLVQSLNAGDEMWS